ncbi:MAG: acetyl-CoA C-acetyltransferase [Burkholderiales bacterium]|jgi:acetyl-CoA C-acetyltransferase
MASKGFFSSFNDIWMVDAVRTPFVDYCGEFSQVLPADMGIKVGREVLKRSGVPAADIGSVIAGNMAPGDPYQSCLPRHVGLYSGVPIDVPAIMAQRICGTGFELIRQAGDQIERGYTDAVLCVGTESMTRNPIASFSHRTGFKLGAPVEFKDYLWESLSDPAPNLNMLQTAENLAQKYGISRTEVDEFAALSFERAVRAQQEGYFAGEIVPVVNETFELEGYQKRSIKLSGKITEVAKDTHPRPSSVEILGKLRAVYPGGVQTGGNSSAVVDGAAAAIITSGAYAKKNGRKPLARIVAAAVVGVPPEIMGIGPAPAIRLLLERTGLTLDQIGCFEINEAHGAQCVAVERELGLDRAKLNPNGGAIAIGHPLAVTGIRLTHTVAREIQRTGQRYGIGAACVGGGQGIALLVENPATL